MKAFKLDSETMQLLDRIRAEADTLMLDGVDLDLAEQAVRELARPVLDKVKMTRLQQDQYRWYQRELTGLLSARTGWDLAFELEVLLRKWVGLGLASRVLQAVLRLAYSGLVAPAVTRKSTTEHSENTEPDRVMQPGPVLPEVSTPQSPDPHNSECLCGSNLPGPNPDPPQCPGGSDSGARTNPQITQITPIGSEEKPSESAPSAESAVRDAEACNG